MNRQTYVSAFYLFLWIATNLSYFLSNLASKNLNAGEVEI